MRIGGNETLGQIELQPPMQSKEIELRAVQMALANSAPFTSFEQMLQEGGNRSLIVSRDGRHLGFMGRMIATSLWFTQLPIESGVVFMPIVGNRTHQGLISEQGVLRDYRLVSREAASEIKKMIPIPFSWKTDFDIDTLVNSIADAYSFAQEALVTASRGNVALARVRLNMKNAGAKGLRDKAQLCFRVLLSMNALSSDEIFTIQHEMLPTLSQAIGDVDAAIARQEISSIRGFIDKVSSIAKGTALQLRSLAKSKWTKFMNVYGSIVTFNQVNLEAIAQYERVGNLSPSDISFLNKMKQSMNKGLLIQNFAESRLKALGISIENVRREAGLSDLGAAGGGAVVAAGTAVGTGVLLNEIRQAIVMGLVMGLVAWAMELQIPSWAKSQRMKINEAKKQIEIEFIAQEEFEDELDKAKAGSDAVNKGVGALEGIPEVSQNEYFKDRIDKTKSIQAQIDSELNSLGVKTESKKKGISPLLLAGGAAAVIGAILLLGKK